MGVESVSVTEVLSHAENREIWKIQIWGQQISRAHSLWALMPNYVTASGSNSILDQLTHLRAQGIYQSGAVSNSAMEQS